MTDSSLPPRADWLVGDEPRREPSVPGGAEQRSARLAARLDAYARYGTLVAEEAAAVLRGDAARAEALAAERAALGEHWAELRAAAEAAGGADAPAAFGDLLSDALRELEHQAAVDLVLRRQLERVAEGLRALPAPAGPSDAGAAEPPTSSSRDDAVAGVVDALAGTLVGARSQGLAGALSGYFPGVTGSAGGAAELATAYAPDGGGAGEGRRLDVRF